MNKLLLVPEGSAAKEEAEFGFWISMVAVQSSEFKIPK